MKFRKDINGLRAIAVIGVLLFHFNAAWMPGGFAGVDVFFVISGFLMTGIIFRGIEQESFSILNFYVARANRIIPALAVLCLILMVFGWFYLTPFAYQALSKHAVSSIGFVSNFVYWAEAGYFDTASHEKWLLHSWSLSVEWQFYILYPLLIVGMRKFISIKTIKPVLLITTILGFVFCIIATYKWPDSSYYLLHTRVWEMMLGGIAYLYPFTLQEKKKKLIEWTGLVLIIGSYFLISAENPWPGYLALFPVVGSFLIIQVERSDSIITSNIILQKLGSWSYSIYLWHWPLVVAIYYFSIPESYIYIGILLSVFFGFLSYKYIEKSIYIVSYRYLKHKKENFLLFLVLFIIFMLMNSFNYNYNYNYNTDAVINNIRRGEYECFDKLFQHNADSSFCKITKGTKKIFLFGDSHSYSVLPSIESIAKDNDLELTYTGYSGCPPIVGIYLERQDQENKNCHDLNDKVIKYILNNSFDYMILSARWTYYTEGDYLGTGIQYIYDEENREITQENSIRTFRDSIKNTFEKYSKSDIKILVLLQVPMQEAGPSTIFYDSSVNNNIDGSKLVENSLLFQKHNDFQKLTNTIIIDEASKFNNVKIVDPTNEMCGITNCPVGNKDESYYFDDNHLSIQGSFKLKELIVKNIFTESD